MEKTKVCIWLDSDLHTYLNESRGEELTIPQYIRLILKQKMKAANKRKPKVATSIGKLEGPTTSSPIVFSKLNEDKKYTINVIRNIVANIFCFEKNNLNINFINILP